MWRTLKIISLNSLKKLNLKYNYSTKFKFKTNQTLTMETILIITKKEMFFDSSKNCIRKLGNLKIHFLTFHLTLFIIYIYI